MKTSSLHIVRRYGPIGGMENYVLELTQALANQGHTVTVLCETCEIEGTNASIHVIALGSRIKKPRWLAQWAFSKSVSNYIESNQLTNIVIHSHERSSVHQVTTFHGPPFLNRKKKALDFLSPRIQMWTFLEKRELLGQQVKAILPNSTLIADQLATHYPSISKKIQAPAYPGVSSTYSQIKKNDRQLTIGFIGREWKRKGLDIACNIVKALQADFPDIHFLVAGCDPNEIAMLFESLPEKSYTLVGWINKPEDFIGKIDLLLHPARAEPFGMGIAEANAAKIPVVISEHCGIASLITAEQGSVCKLDPQMINLTPWVEACQTLLMTPFEATPLGLSWDQLATQHINLYRSLQY